MDKGRIFGDELHEGPTVNVLKDLTSTGSGPIGIRQEDKFVSCRRDQRAHLVRVGTNREDLVSLARRSEGFGQHGADIDGTAKVMTAVLNLADGEPTASLFHLPVHVEDDLFPSV